MKTITKIKNFSSGLSVQTKIVLFAPLLITSVVYLGITAGNSPSDRSNGLVAASSTSTVASPKKTMIEINYEEIAYQTKYIEDSTLNEGEQLVKKKGEKGEKTVTYEVSYTYGKETARKKIKEEIVVKPQTRVVLVGSAKKFDPKTLNTSDTKKRQESSTTENNNTKTAPTDKTEEEKPDIDLPGNNRADPLGNRKD